MKLLKRVSYLFILMSRLKNPSHLPMTISPVRYSISILILSILACYCAPSNPNRPIHSTLEYQLGVDIKDTKQLPLDTLLGFSEWIPLQGVNINAISKMAVGSDFIVVFNESDLNEIINIIGFNHKGEATFVIDYNNPLVPNIINISDVRIKEDTLALLNYSSQKIVYLDSKGIYQRAATNYITGDQFFLFDEMNGLFLSGSKNYHPISRATGHIFYVYNQDQKKVLHSFAPFPPIFEDSGMSMAAFSIFQSKDPQRVLCYTIANDTIYQASAKSHSSKYLLDFPNRSLKNATLEKLNKKYLTTGRAATRSEAIDFVQNPKFLHNVTFIHEFDSYLLLSFSYGTKKRYLSLFDLNNQKSYTFEIADLNNLFQNRFFQGGPGFIYLTASDPETLFEKNTQLSLPREMIPEAGDEANPIVFKIPLDLLVQYMIN